MTLQRDFVEVSEFFDEMLLQVRDEQTAYERVLQAQFVSRISFIAGQMGDLDFATHRRIIEHGIR